MRHFAPLAGSGTPRIESPDVAPGVTRGDAICTLCMVTLFFSCLCVPLSGAQVSASLSGLITDPSGAAVSAASVIAKNLDTGLSRTVPTDQGGRYRFFALPVGPYEISVTKDGFAQRLRS